SGQSGRGFGDCGAARALERATQLQNTVAGTEEDQAPFDAQTVSADGSRVLDRSTQSGGAVRNANGPEDFMVIIPAFNEEGAIAKVIGELRQVLPDTPVLVIDDCSRDGTKSVARLAGADVLPLPHHLGLGGCVQAGYKLAFELGFEYVIRVDGDGQHDARDIPRILDRLK